MVDANVQGFDILAVREGGVVVLDVVVLDIVVPTVRTAHEGNQKDEQQVQQESHGVPSFRPGR